jgi:hypothetical protein
MVLGDPYTPPRSIRRGRKWLQAGCSRPSPISTDRLGPGAASQTDRTSEPGDQGELTLISAPAGFGKTTLLAEWLATAEAGRGPAARVAPDHSDNEPTLFWAYLVAALQTVHAQVGTRARSLRNSPQPLPVETLLRTLLNEISALSQRIMLVLDDYHLIAAPPVHQGIAFLLDHLPPQLHMGIAGRADPPLPLSRIRGAVSWLSYAPPTCVSPQRRPPRSSTR